MKNSTRKKARPKRLAESVGELWAKCPECRTPVKDAELFKHLLNCPGAEVRKAEWAAQQAAAATEPEPGVAMPAADVPQ